MLVYKAVTLRQFACVYVCLLGLVLYARLAQGFGFSLRAEQIPNDGFAPVESIGETADSALVCVADPSTCCSNRVGIWLYPNGTEVPSQESTGWTFWTSFGAGVVRLHRSQQFGFGRNATGLYRCQVPTTQGATVTFHVGVYNRNDASQLNIPNGIQFTLESETNTNSLVFSLSCGSVQGPVTNISWTLNGEDVCESWLQVSQVDNEIGAVYHNSLTVPGRHIGQYRCTIFNNQEGSMTSATLYVQAASMPRDVFVSQVNDSAFRVAWVQPSNGAAVIQQRVYIESESLQRSIDTAANVQSLLLTGLPDASTFRVSVHALSDQLPSLVTFPVSKYLAPFPPLSPPVITTLIATSHTSLTVTWEQSDDVDYIEVSFSYFGACDYEHQGIAGRRYANLGSISINGLQEYSQYMVTVSASNNGRKASASRLGTTMPGAPGQPTMLSASTTNVSATSVQATWSHTCINRHADIAGYSLQVQLLYYSWTPYSCPRYYSCSAYSVVYEPFLVNISYNDHRGAVHPAEYTYVISGLLPNAEYSISVAGVDHDGVIGDYSSGLTARTSHPSALVFMLNGNILPNNSAISLEEIGRDEHALFCLTNLSHHLSSERQAEWYFPNQSALFGRGSALGGLSTMYRNRGEGMILLHRLSGGVEGIYRCDIPDHNYELHSLFVKIYNASVSVPITIGELQFQLTSKLLFDPPTFKLFCVTSQSLTVDTEWSKNDVNIVSNNEFQVASKIINGDMVQTLTVTGRFGGLYKFSIAEYPRSHLVSRELNIQVPQVPRNVIAKQLGRTSYIISWLPPRQVRLATGYRIYINSGTLEDPQYYYNAGTLANRATIHGLISGQTYNLTMITLSETLPSRMTDLLTITVQTVQDVTVSIVKRSSLAITGNSFSLTCMASLQRGTLQNNNISVHWLDVTTYTEPSNAFNETSYLNNRQSYISVWYIEQLNSAHTGRYICSVDIEGILYEEHIDFCVQEQVTAASLFVRNGTLNSTHFLAGGRSTLECVFVIRDLTLVNSQLAVMWYNSSMMSIPISNDSRSDVYILSEVSNNSSCNVTYQTTLVFTAAGYYDSGEYVCRVMLNGILYEQTTEVIVDFPLMIMPSPNRVPLAGEQFSLSCVTVVFLGITPTILWVDSLNKTMSSTTSVTSEHVSGPTEFTSVLDFGVVETSDAGNYTCQVHFSQRPELVTKTVIVMIEIPPPDVTLTSNETGILYSGTILKLTCTVRLHSAVNTPVAVQIQWINGGNNNVLSTMYARLSEEIGVWTSSYVVRFQSFLYDSEMFTYQCMVVANPSGSSVLPNSPVSQSTDIIIATIFPPSGPPENFTVTSRGSRNVIFSWDPPVEGARNGPITAYSLVCCPDLSSVDGFMSDECIEEFHVTERPFSLGQFTPGTMYNCSLTAFTEAGEGPLADLDVITLADEALFQLHLIGVPNCSQWVACDGPVKSEAISSIVENVIRSNCTMTNNCFSGLQFEIQNEGFTCGSSPNQVSFKASLSSNGNETASDLVSILQNWIHHGQTINVNSLFLQVNNSCLAAIDILETGTHCDSMPTHLPVCEVNGAALAGGVFGSFIACLVTFTVVFIITFCMLSKKHKTKRHEFSSDGPGLDVPTSKANNAGLETELYEIPNIDVDSQDKDYEYVSIRARYTPAASAVARIRSEKSSRIDTAVDKSLSVLSEDQRAPSLDVDIEGDAGIDSNTQPIKSSELDHACTSTAGEKCPQTDNATESEEVMLPRQKQSSDHKTRAKMKRDRSVQNDVDGAMFVNTLDENSDVYEELAVKNGEAVYENIMVPSLM